MINGNALRIVPPVVEIRQVPGEVVAQDWKQYRQFIVDALEYEHDEIDGIKVLVNLRSGNYLGIGIKVDGELYGFGVVEMRKATVGWDLDVLLLAGYNIEIWGDDFMTALRRVCVEKLAQVQERWPAIDAHTFPPIPVKRLGDRVVMTDGHTRALVACLSGLSQIRVYWDEDDLDWEAYEICVAWRQADGVRSIADLKDRVVGEEYYERLWHRRRRAMHRELADDRRAASR